MCLFCTGKTIVMKWDSDSSNSFWSRRFSCAKWAFSWHKRLNVTPSLTMFLDTSTHLKNIGQTGSFPQLGMKIQNIWHHHPAFVVGETFFPCVKVIRKKLLFWGRRSVWHIHRTSTEPPTKPTSIRHTEIGNRPLKRPHFLWLTASQCVLKISHLQLKQA